VSGAGSRVLWVAHPDSGGPGVFGEGAEMVAAAAHESPLPAEGFDAVVLYGAETNIEDAPALPWLRDETAWLRAQLDAGVPVLGICFGAELIAHALGAEVVPTSPEEIGFFPVTLSAAGRADPVLGVLPERFLAAQWHSFHCSLPAGGLALADSAACLQAFRAGSALAVQFHPEVDARTLEGWIASEDAEPPGFAGRGDLLPRWNELGRRLFGAWLSEARRRPPGRPSA